MSGIGAQSGVVTRSARTALLVAAAAALAALAGAVAIAQADYLGPDETMSQAYGPLRGDFTYSAKLKSGNDADWFFFYVPTAGDHLHWSVQNTTSLTTCPPLLNTCTMYATLIDQNGKQVGGDNSSAGTGGVDAGQSDQIDWTFAQPGKYYLLIQQDGDGPSYQFSVSPASGLSSSPPSGSGGGAGGGGAGGGGATGGAGGSGGGGNAAKGFHLKVNPRPTGVRIGLVLPSGVSSLQAGLTLNGRNAGRTTLRHPAEGAVHFTIPLRSSTAAALRRRHSVTLILTVKVAMRGGKVQRATRKVVVTR